jgi:DegV family protein with EDD domain
MSDQVAVVTDSTAYLPKALAQEHAIRVVPVQVVIGGTTYSEGIDVDPAAVVAALREWRPVTTSRPTPQAFAETYAAAAAAGATSVVSVHLSSKMSGTFESAAIAAREAEIPVTVIDSGLIGMAMGFAAIAGAEAAAGGCDADAVARVVRARCLSASSLFYVDTLEYLRRGGRIGPATARLGAALSVKPLLQLVDGAIEPLEKVRTATRAIARLEELAVERAGESEVDLAVQHLNDEIRATILADHLAKRVPGVQACIVEEVGAVVGTHVGPGMLGVVVSPR